MEEDDTNYKALFKDMDDLLSDFSIAELRAYYEWRMTLLAEVQRVYEENVPDFDTKEFLQYCNKMEFDDVFVDEDEDEIVPPSELQDVHVFAEGFFTFYIHQYLQRSAK